MEIQGTEYTNYEEKDLLESYHIVSLAQKLTIVVIVILKNIQVQRLRQKKYCRMRYFINGKIKSFCLSNVYVKMENLSANSGSHFRSDFTGETNKNKLHI